MSNVFMIADTHFGHEKLAVGFRGFESLEAHDEALIELWNMTVTKRDTVTVLGDFAWKSASLSKIAPRLKGNKKIVLGNHDTHSSAEYMRHFSRMYGMLKLGRKIQGFESVWLSHAPIHPQENWRTEVNIHGHIHDENLNLGEGYLNVCADVLSRKWTPVPFDELFLEYQIQCNRHAERAGKFSRILSNR